MAEPLIVPRPRLVDLGAVVADPGPVVEIVDPSLPAQGYDLVITEAATTLRHADDAGRRYGLQTLDQLGAAGLREGHIRDWPDLPARGFMLDISRDRVPDRACLEALADRLERVRINHLELYTEHTFAYADHEVVWRDASPLTAEDIVWFDATCAARGIELVANQNCFGHFERWLVHEPYRHRAVDPTMAHPRSLAPTEDNARFALDLVAELTGHLTSRKVNLGCDEVFELQGRAEVFTRHLARLLAGARDLGLAPCFWADMVQVDPRAAADLVGDATALLWHYEAPMGDEVAGFLETVELPEPFDGLAQEWLASGAHLGFGPRAEQFAGAGLDWWVCPGTSGWNSFVGRWSNARENLLDAARAAAEHGASGMLITEWGDNGHLQPPSVMLPALTLGASLAWCEGANRDLDVVAALDGYVLPEATGTAGRALLEIGEVYARTGVMVPNGSALFHAVAGGGVGAFGDPDVAQLTGVVDTLEEAEATFAAARFTDQDAAIVARELRQAVALARYGARLVGGDPPDVDPAALIAEQAACWDLRSRPGGRDDSLARLQPRRP
jgi:hexosaminidase